MAGSKGGKHSKSKRKHKSEKPEPLNLNIDPEKISNRIPDGPKDPKDKNPHPAMNFPMTASSLRYTEEMLEQLLLERLEQSYLKAKRWLLDSGYGLAEVDRAILNAGSIDDALEIQKNILANLLSFIEGKSKPKREAFKGTDELYKTMLQILVFTTMEACPGMQRAYIMRFLLLRDWGSLPPITMTSHLQSGSHGSNSQSKNENVEKVPHESNNGIFKRVNLKRELVSHFKENVRTLTTDIRAQIGAPIIKQQAIPNSIGFCTSVEGSSFVAFLRTWLESDSGDDTVTPQLVDLVKNISNLYEEVKAQKEWAERKVVDSAKKLNNDLLDLMMLRMEKLSTEQLQNEKIRAQKEEALSSLKILRKETSLLSADYELDHRLEAIRMLEIQKAEMRANLEALKIDASESNRELKEVLKRERKCIKKHAEIEKQKIIFQQQHEEEMRRFLLLEKGLLEAEKDAEDAEIKWRHEIAEREQMFALLDEEIKMAEARKSSSKAELLKLRQKVEIDSQLALDDCRRLEDELSSLHIANRMSDLLLEDDIFLHRSLEGTSCQSNVPYEKISHWNCMICVDSEVDVVFLPCTHQVVCSSCYEEKCTMRGQCPYCGVQIEQSIRVYGVRT